MSYKIAVIGVAAMAAGCLSGCGEHQGGVAATGPSAPQVLDTAQVAALAQQSSEISAPFGVDEGAVSLADDSDTAEPIAINAM